MTPLSLSLPFLYAPSKFLRHWRHSVKQELGLTFWLLLVCYSRRFSSCYYLIFHFFTPKYSFFPRVIIIRSRVPALPPVHLVLYSPEMDTQNCLYLTQAVLQRWRLSVLLTRNSSLLHDILVHFSQCLVTGEIVPVILGYKVPDPSVSPHLHL